MRKDKTTNKPSLATLFEPPPSAPATTEAPPAAAAGGEPAASQAKRAPRAKVGTKPASKEGKRQASQEGSLEPSKEGTSAGESGAGEGAPTAPPPAHPLAHLWTGKDAQVKLSVDVPERIAIKLTVAKSARLVKNQKTFAAEVLERALDALLDAQAREVEAARTPKQPEQAELLH